MHQWEFKMEYNTPSENNNASWEIDEVKNLGLEYFRNLVQQAEENGLRVYPSIKGILDWWESGKPLTPKQAEALMNYKHGFES